MEFISEKIEGIVARIENKFVCHNWKVKATSKQKWTKIFRRKKENEIIRDVESMMYYLWYVYIML